MELAVGDSFEGRYQVVARLAKGGMGVVYEALDLRLQRRVALKVLMHQLSENRDALARFQREAIAVARLRHPAIPQVHDAGTSSRGEPYLIMELVEGRTLSKMLAEGGAMAPALAADLARQLANALASAHEAGVLHRDLKPANAIVVQENGRAALKLLDFGIARLRDSDAYTRLTQLGEIMGTPSFMAPEQARGTEADVRTDVYGVGVVLYCLLTARRPFAGTDLGSIVRQVLTEVPTRADVLVPSVPSALASICARAMEKDPNRRFASMPELEAALAHAQLTAMAPGSSMPPPSQMVPRNSWAPHAEPTGPASTTALSPSSTAPGSTAAFAMPVPLAPSSVPWRWILAAAVGGGALVACLATSLGVAFFLGTGSVPPLPEPEGITPEGPTGAAWGGGWGRAAPRSDAPPVDMGEMPAGLSPTCARMWVCCGEYSRVTGAVMNCSALVGAPGVPFELAQQICNETRGRMAGVVQNLGGDGSACDAP